MIRILQQDNRIIKAVFALVIGAAIITMVITLVPGIFDNGAANDASVFATVRNPGFFGKFGESTSVKMADVLREAQQQAKRNNYPDFAVNFLVPRVGQQQVERAVLVREADKLGLSVSDADLARELQHGVFAQYLFPNGVFVGQDKYIDFVSTYFQVPVEQFENEVKGDLEIQRLQSLVTGGINISDAAVRADYMKTGTKVKFDYAVVSADDIKKTLNPSDADLQAFFKQNASRYSTAVPETRKVQFFSFSDSDLPGGAPKISDAEIQGAYDAQKEKYTVPEQVQTRHILISVPKGADAKTDAAAKAKAAGILAELKAGGNFAELAKKNSDDPGSKDKGGELPMIPTSNLDPAYAKAAMALSPGQTSDLVRSSFGYHIIQTVAKDAAHTQPLAEVKGQITAELQNKKSAAMTQGYANTLVTEAKSKGMAATAAAHGMHVQTTDWLGRDGTIGTLADSTGVLTAAFAAAKGAAPQSASTGEGYAIFQVVDVQAAHAPAFADWKSHVMDDYKEQKAPEMLNDELIKLSARAKALGDLKKAAEEMKVPVKSSDLVGRDAQVADLGAMTGGAVVAFDLPKGGISGPINNGPNGAVLEVTDKQEPTADDIATNLPATREKLLQAEQEQAFSVFAGDLMQRYEKAGAVVYSKKQTPASPLGN